MLLSLHHPRVRIGYNSLRLCFCDVFICMRMTSRHFVVPCACRLDHPEGHRAGYWFGEGRVGRTHGRRGGKAPPNQPLHVRERYCYYSSRMPLCVCVCVRACVWACVRVLVLVALFGCSPNSGYQCNMATNSAFVFVVYFCCLSLSGSFQHGGKQRPSWYKGQPEEGALHV